MTSVVIVWSHPLFDKLRISQPSLTDPVFNEDAVSFCEHAFKTENPLSLIFFYGAGVKQLGSTSPLATRWQKLTQHFPLKICSQALQTYPTQLAFEVPLAGLGECFGACLAADKTIIFPPGPQDYEKLPDYFHFE